MVILIGPAAFPIPKDKSETMLALSMLPLGPGLAGVLLTGLVLGRSGLRDFASRWLKWRVDARWYVAALAYPLLSVAVILSFSLLLDGFSYELAMTEDRASLLVTGIVGGGLVVAILEESGWTGFAITRLRLSHGVLVTGMIVGVIWGAWHFLMFWEEDTFSAALPLALLLVRLFSWLPPFRVLLLIAYERTGSLPVVMLMHAGASAVAVIFAPITDSGALIMASILIPASVLWIVVAAVAIRERPLSWPSRREAQSVATGGVGPSRFAK
jgi:membrane protease YdiL (CAAX protease family)